MTFTPGHDSVPFPADSIPLFDTGTAVKEIANVGKFEVDAEGKVTFTPDKQFKRTPELELTRVDCVLLCCQVPSRSEKCSFNSNGCHSNGIQSQPPRVLTFTEESQLFLDSTKPMTFEDGRATKTVPGGEIQHQSRWLYYLYTRKTICLVLQLQ